jgi:hypothetical protein
VRLTPVCTAAVAALVALTALPVTTATAAAAPSWRKAAHRVTDVVRASSSAGHAPAVLPVDRSGLPLRSAKQGLVGAHALGTPLSTWHVIYDAGMTQPQKDAFQRAVDIWSHSVASSQTITVTAHLKSFTDPSVLGLGQTMFSSPPPDFSVFYPVALANSLANDDLDPGAAGTGPGQGVDDPAHADFDIALTDTPNVFHFDDAGNIATETCTPVPTVDNPSPTAKAGACVDATSVVLHEIGHTLGLEGSAQEDFDGAGADQGTASYGFDPYGANGGAPDPTPFVFDLFTETTNGTAILDYPSPNGTALHDALTGDGLFWFGSEGAQADRGREPRLYAPATFVPNGTFSSLDEDAYPTGDADALMTPTIHGGELTRDPGEVALGMLRDIGWVTPVPAGSRYTPVAPSRVLDTGAALVSNGGVRDIALSSKVPANATAVVLNLTTVQPVGGSAVRAYPVPRLDGAPVPTAMSTVTSPKDERSDLVTVPLSKGGPANRALRVRLQNRGGAGRLLADLVGYYAPNGQLYFHPMIQRRAADTRTGAGLPKHRLVAGAPEDLVMANTAGVPSSAVAVAMAVTVVNPSVNTNVTAYTPGTPGFGWAVDLHAGTVEANQAIVRLAGGKARFKTYKGTTDLVVDVAGWYDTNAIGGTRYHNALAQRLDTGTAKLGPNGTSTILVADGTYGVPTTAKAVVVNLQGIVPSSSTYFSIYRTGTTPILNSVLNLAAGRTAATMATISLATGANLGKFTLHNAGGTAAYAIDLQGWFGPT